MLHQNATNDRKKGPANPLERIQFKFGLISSVFAWRNAAMNAKGKSDTD